MFVARTRLTDEAMSIKPHQRRQNIAASFLFQQTWCMVTKDTHCMQCNCCSTRSLVARSCSVGRIRHSLLRAHECVCDNTCVKFISRNSAWRHRKSAIKQPGTVIGGVLFTCGSHQLSLACIMACRRTLTRVNAALFTYGLPLSVNVPQATRLDLPAIAVRTSHIDATQGTQQQRDKFKGADENYTDCL